MEAEAVPGAVGMQRDGSSAPSLAQRGHPGTCWDMLGHPGSAKGSSSPATPPQSLPVLPEAFPFLSPPFPTAAPRLPNEFGEFLRAGDDFSKNGKQLFALLGNGCCLVSI